MLEFLILLVFLISCALISIFGSGLSNTVEQTIYITQNIIQKVILLSTFVLHALGKIGILVILGTALFILSNDFLVIFGFHPMSDVTWYKPLLSLFKEPHTWAAATAIIAATTAITTSKKLEMDTQDHLHKMRERNETRYQEQQRRQKEQLQPLYNRVISAHNVTTKTCNIESDSETKES